jgi:hypothetical protein
MVISITFLIGLLHQAHLLFFLLHLEMEPPKAVIGGEIYGRRYRPYVFVVQKIWQVKQLALPWGCLLEFLGKLAALADVSINGNLHHEHAPFHIKLISRFSFFA